MLLSRDWHQTAQLAAGLQAKRPQLKAEMGCGEMHSFFDLTDQQGASTSNEQDHAGTAQQGPHLTTKPYGSNEPTWQALQADTSVQAASILRSTADTKQQN